MFSFQSKSRQQHGKPAPRQQSSALEQRLFGTPPAPIAEREAGGHDWYKSSSELREGCDVTQDIALDTLPPEWARLFQPIA